MRNATRLYNQSQLCLAHMYIVYDEIAHILIIKMINDFKNAYLKWTIDHYLKYLDL